MIKLIKKKIHLETVRTIFSALSFLIQLTSLLILVHVYLHIF